MLTLVSEPKRHVEIVHLPLDDRGFWDKLTNKPMTKSSPIAIPGRAMYLDLTVRSTEPLQLYVKLEDMDIEGYRIYGLCPVEQITDDTYLCSIDAWIKLVL